MNDEIRAAMRQTYREMGEAMLQDERRMASFLADILGNRYPGERLLLRQLVQTGLPRMIVEGRATAENLPHKAAYVAETYFWDKDMTLAAARVWFETLTGKTAPPPVPTKQPPLPPPAPKRLPSPPSVPPPAAKVRRRSGLRQACRGPGGRRVHPRQPNREMTATANSRRSG